MNVAGSPTSVSSPAELLTIAVRINGRTMSMSSAFATRTITGAINTTVVAFGSNAHSGATSTSNSSRNRLPLPRVAVRYPALIRSKMPVLPSVCATIMPPASNSSGPDAESMLAITSALSRMPVASSTLTPSSAATAISTMSNAIATITAANTARVSTIWNWVIARAPA